VKVEVLASRLFEFTNRAVSAASDVLSVANQRSTWFRRDAEAGVM
jgi:hypothetical protein